MGPSGWISALRSRGTRKPIHSPHVAPGKDHVSSQPAGSPHQNPSMSASWVWTARLQKWEEINGHCLSHLVYILLWWTKKTEGTISGYVLARTSALHTWTIIQPHTGTIMRQKVTVSLILHSQSLDTMRDCC